MAHRPTRLSQCQHTLCRCTLALCPHSLWAWGVWGSCPSCLQEQLFLSGTGEGACTPSTACDLPQAFGREIILQFGKPHQMHKRPAGATAKSSPGAPASPSTPARLSAPHWKGKEPLPLLLGLKEHLQDWNQSKPAVKNEGEKAGKHWLLWLGKTLLKKNKEKGKTDPIWEANEIQIQNRTLRSVSHKVATLGAAFTCGDAVPLGPLETPLHSAAGLVLPWSILGCDWHGTVH